METEEKITERIKTFEDALKETGRPNVPEFLDMPEDLRDYFKAQYKMSVIAEALNEGLKADWSDKKQKNYAPIFWSTSPHGFVFYIVDCAKCSFPTAGYAARLCFRTRNLAQYAGEQFLEIYRDLITK